MKSKNLLLIGIACFLFSCNNTLENKTYFSTYNGGYGYARYELRFISDKDCELKCIINHNNNKQKEYEYLDKVEYCTYKYNSPIITLYKQDAEQKNFVVYKGTINNYEINLSDSHDKPLPIFISTSEKIPYKELSTILKSKYSTYKDIEDFELVMDFIKQYPYYDIVFDKDLRKILENKNINLQTLHNRFSELDNGFTRTYDDFVIDMQDENNRRYLYNNLCLMYPDYKDSFEEFSTKMGISEIMSEKDNEIGVSEMISENINLKKLYQNVSKKYNLPDYETFKRGMADEIKRHQFYDKLYQEYDLPDFDTFSADIGFPINNNTSKIQTSGNQKEWTLYEIGKIGKISVPPTLELRKDNSVYTLGKEILDEVTAARCKIDIDKLIFDLTFQPKGTDKLDKNATEKYARVLVKYRKGKNGDYPKYNDKLTTSDLKEYNEIIKKQYIDDFIKVSGKNILQQWENVKLVDINGVSTLTFGYVRDGINNTKIKVREYNFYNSDEFVNIVISYRVSESNLWADDFSKIANTFKFSVKK